MLRINFPWQRQHAAIRRAAEKAYRSLMKAALVPEPYKAGWVPDTFEARAGMVTAHSAVMVVRLADIGSPSSVRLVGAINDLVLDGFDAAYRELGVGDAAIARKVRKLAEFHSGGGKAIVDTLKGDDETVEALAVVLQRNGYVTPGGGRPVAELLDGALARFRQQNDHSVLQGSFDWPQA